MRIIIILIITGVIMNAAAKDLKVLMIGNSFSICVGRNLPQLVAHEKKHNIELTSAYIGGCTLKTHAANLKIAEKDPKVSMYRINTWNSKDLRKRGTRKGNVNELLKNNRYDIITVQQGSYESWDYKFYQPYADEIIAYIKKYNPQAEIVIQQTWAYRSDNARLAAWKMTRDEMSEKVINAYNEFAGKTGFRIIPVGEAIANARKTPQYKFTALSKKALAAFVCPDLPPLAHDPVGKYSWQKDSRGMSMKIDSIHLNEHGEYLQACVWYAFLFGEDAEKITYEPNLASSTCKILCKSAAEAIKKYKNM